MKTNNSKRVRSCPRIVFMRDYMLMKYPCIDGGVCHPYPWLVHTPLAVLADYGGTPHKKNIPPSGGFMQTTGKIKK